MEEDTYPDKTMATASFSTLSPKTNAQRSTSTLRSWKMARIVTGSVAEMIAPNMRQSLNPNPEFGIRRVTPNRTALQRKVAYSVIYLGSVNNTALYRSPVKVPILIRDIWCPEMDVDVFTLQTASIHIIYYKTIYSYK